MIRECTDRDLVDIMDERNAAAIGKEKITPMDLVIIDEGEHKMGAFILENGTDCEIHLLCPKRSAIRSRALCNELIEHMRAEGFKRIYTTVGDPYKKAYNLAIKLGFSPIERSSGHTIFVRYLWE